MLNSPTSAARCKELLGCTPFDAIRNQRSAEAAKEIKALIMTSRTQVEEGVDLVGQTGEALTRIVAKVGEISAIVIGIANSTHEQSTALEQVNTAVNQMDQTTQQNAAMVEQATAATHALAQKADCLAQLIDQFKVGSQPRSAPASRPKRASPGRAEADAPKPNIRRKPGLSTGQQRSPI